MPIQPANASSRIVTDKKEHGQNHEETKRLKSYTGNLKEFVPPDFMNLYTLRDMRNARWSSLLSKVYHKCTRELYVYIHTQTPSLPLKGKRS